MADSAGSDAIFEPVLFCDLSVWLFWCSRFVTAELFL